MMETLFFIRDHVGAYAMFGAGILLAAWAVFSVVLMAWLLWRQGSTADTWGHVPLLLLVAAVICFVLPQIVKPGQGLPIRGYGVMLLLAVVAGTVLSAYRGWRFGLDPDMIVSLVFWGIVPGFVGGRLFYVIQKWPDFFREADGGSFRDWLAAATARDWLATAGRIVNITEGGLVVYGALAGAMIGFGTFIVRHRLPALAMFDLLAPGMLLGLTLGRIGCLMYGCCFGGACDLPWAVRFPKDSLPYVHQAEHGDLYLQGLKLGGKPDDPPVIAAVEPDSPPEIAGAKAGQRIRAINGFPVAGSGSANRLLYDAERFGDEVLLAVDGVAAPLRWNVVPLPDRGVAVHPTQIYSSIDALVLCLFLLAYDPFRRRDGELLAIVLTIYPIDRFLMETIRTDETGVLGTIFSIGQMVSIILLLAAAGLWFLLLRRPPGKALPLPVDAG
jgi:phosphatidylglycerol:prolipoprotein diacylglycerol transferase